MSRSRIAFAAVILAVLLAVGAAADFALNLNKIYGGVTVGTVDVSGKTVDEAATLIEEAYAPLLAAGSAYIFASDSAAAGVNGAVDEASETPVAEQAAVKEALSSGQLWIADAAGLGASVDARGLAEEAFQVAREGGFFERLKARLGGCALTPRAVYGEGALEELAASIDAVLGSPRVDYGVAVEGGVAVVTEGHDGTMLDRVAFAGQVDAALLSGERTSFTALPAYAPLRITQAQAQAVADEVNRAVAGGTEFSLGNGGWSLTATDTAAFVVTRVEQVGEGFELLPYIDVQRAQASILDRAAGLMRSSLPAAVTFSQKDGEVTVSTDGSGMVPLAAETAQRFDGLMFGAFRASRTGAAQGAEDAALAAPDGVNPVVVEVTYAASPATMTFAEALDLGVVTAFSSYTTEYTNTAEDANRVHNIQLAGSLLNNSIVKADGGSWSFHEVVGHCNEEAGFLGAGIILNEEHVDAVGGGICQVATTVFNAVYDAGLQVDRRHNHTLYVGYYPDGRDAAVSWPDLDFIWSNDTSSDILVTSSHTDTSFTVTLYGVDPQRRVETSATDWKVLARHETRLSCNEAMAKGSYKVEQEGDDARSITVYRTVYDEGGAIVHENAFTSKYDAEAEIIVAGPGTEIELESGKKLVAEAGKTVTGT